MADPGIFNVLKIFCKTEASFHLYNYIYIPTQLLNALKPKDRAKLESLLSIQYSVIIEGGGSMYPTSYKSSITYYSLTSHKDSKIVYTLSNLSERESHLKEIEVLKKENKELNKLKDSIDHIKGVMCENTENK